MSETNPLFPVKDQFPVLDKDISVDITVVGGGITGISCAFHLAKNGYKVAVLEEQEVGSGATGASSGILYYGTGTDLKKATELFGKEKAPMLWKESKLSIDTMEKIIENNSIECDLRKPGALMVAKNEDEGSFLEQELAALKDIGFEGDILQSEELKTYFTQKEFVAGLLQNNVSQIAPGLFAAGLAKTANLSVYNNSPLVNYKEEKDSVIIETPKAKVKSQKVVFATNRKPFFGLENYFFIENSVILASKRLSKEQIRDIWPEHKIIWTAEDKYDIIYEHDSRAILEFYYFKGARDKIKYYLPNFDFVQEYTWGDSWSKTNDWLPIMGKIKENIYAAIAMGDQGIVMGFTAGRKIVDLISGRQDDLLDMVSPKRFLK